MLRAHDGEVEIHGKKLDLQCELTHLINRLIKCEALTEKEVDECVKMAKLSDEQLSAKLEQVLNKWLERLCLDF